MIDIWDWLKLEKFSYTCIWNSWVSSTILSSCFAQVAKTIKTLCLEWHRIASQMWVIIDSGNGLLPGSPMPLPELTLPYHQRCSVAFMWEQFPKCSWTQSITCVCRLHLKLLPHLPAAIQFNSVGHSKETENDRVLLKLKKNDNNNNHRVWLTRHLLAHSPFSQHISVPCVVTIHHTLCQTYSPLWASVIMDQDDREWQEKSDLCPLLLTWFNLNPSMDK